MSLCGVACDDEVESRPPEYPEAIGYTPPVASARPPAAPPIAASAPPAAGPDESTAVLDDPSSDAPVGAPDDGPEAAADDPGYADADPAALNDFRPALDPYGSWVDDPTYGQAWVPSPDVVGSDFTPYVSDGHWAYDDDYTWVSDYSWGWAPFHYGRWAYANGPGWEWIPGRRYAGAWVSWRYGEGGYGYVGWAPMSPTWGWHHGVAVGLGFVPRAPYAFVETQSLFASNLPGHVVAGPRAGIVAGYTRPWIVGHASVGGGRVGLGGPSPAALHIDASTVVHASPANRGLAQARAFAHASSAVALGARYPARSPSPATYRGAPPAWRSGGGEPSHFGGRFGAGFTGTVGGVAPRTLTGRGGGPGPYYGSPESAPMGRPGPAFGGYRGVGPGAPGRGGWGGAPAGIPGGFRGGSVGGGHFGGGGGGSHTGGFGGGHSGGGGRGGGRR